MATWEGKLDGEFDYGACGMVPLIRVNHAKPRLRNNGFNCYGGHPVVHVPGLAAALPDEGRPIRQGHVMVVYRDGKQFGTYADTVRGNDLYAFS